MLKQLLSQFLGVTRYATLRQKGIVSGLLRLKIQFRIIKRRYHQAAAAKGANGKLGEITERNLGIVVTAEAIG